VELERTARLPYRAPLDFGALLDFLARRAVPGVEEVVGRTYRRSVRLAGGPGLVELSPADGFLRARFRLADGADLDDAVGRVRRLADLDADPAAIVAALGDDAIIGASVRGSPGLRTPGTVDPGELAFRAVLGQQVSLGSAAAIAARVVREHGEPLADPIGSVTHVFPTADRLAALEPVRLAMPDARGRALVALAAELAAGRLVLAPGTDRAATRTALLAIPGIGPWTADYIAIRGLGDRDAFPATDLWIRRALRSRPVDPARWRPYRAYAAQHLWRAGSA
jgi:AraC family transcriptional regulator of adaptative response / DNA-3-methyladenine glycosylase II